MLIRPSPLHMSIGGFYSHFFPLLMVLVLLYIVQLQRSPAHEHLQQKRVGSPTA